MAHKPVNPNRSSQRRRNVRNLKRPQTPVTKKKIERKIVVSDKKAKDSFGIPFSASYGSISPPI